MAASTAEIANVALSHLGVAGAITTLSTDTTTAGKACRIFYQRAVRETLMAHDWACARAQDPLVLQETFTDTATREWLYAYWLPQHALVPRRILWGGIRNPRQDQQVPFTVKTWQDLAAWDSGTTYAEHDYVSYSSTFYRALRETLNDIPSSSADDWLAVSNIPNLLLCDIEDAVLEFTYDMTEVSPTRFTADLENAIALLLAYYVAPSVTMNGSGVNLRGQVLQAWDFVVKQAQATDYNARQRDLPPISVYQASRSYGPR